MLKLLAHFPLKLLRSLSARRDEPALTWHWQSTTRPAPCAACEQQHGALDLITYDPDRITCEQCLAIFEAGAD